MGEQTTKELSSDRALEAMATQGFVPGGMLGGYMIDRFIAEGGMGEVYLAREMFSGRKVAIKRVRANLEGRPDLSERLQIEARILAELDHPCIVAMLFSGEHEGRGYIVMEWLEGKTLREFMSHRGKPLELQDALYYAILIAGALRAAHKVGILHRDLKPENIFLLKGGKLKVLDFGLGKLSEHAGTTDRLAPMATVYYAAPEQLQRTGVDERADVYALGLIFLEMATGRHAFADLPGVLPQKEIVQANQMFATPNSLRTLLPGCPESLAALVERALAKDRAQRPMTEELLMALRAERTALLAAKAAATKAANDEDEDESEDEPAPAPAQAREAAPAPTPAPVSGPQLKTEPLAEGFRPRDPSATGARKFVPVRHTVRMPEAPPAPPWLKPMPPPPAPPAPPAPDTETSSAGRIATLPPPTPRAPVFGAPPPLPRGVGAPTPAVTDATRSERREHRESIEFASRPTLPWQPKPRGAAISSTPAPTHGSAPPARAAIPLWTAPLVGVLMALGAFAIFVGLRRARIDPPAVGAAPAASVAAEPAVVPSATATATVTVTATVTATATLKAAPAATSTPAARPKAPAPEPISSPKRTDPRPTSRPRVIN